MGKGKIAEIFTHKIARGAVRRAPRGMLAAPVAAAGVMAVLLLSVLGAGAARAQAQAPRAAAAWRGAGPTPCVGADGGAYKCPPAPQTIAVRAGRLFDSKTGQMLTKQVTSSLATESRRWAGRAGKDSGGSAGDRPSRATVLPGLIDAHTHMFDTRGPKSKTDGKLHADRRTERAGRPAGRLHGGARYEFPRKRIRRHRDPRRDQRGPHRRAAVSGVDAGHRLGRTPPNPALRTIRWPARWCARWKTRARPCGSRSRMARIGSSCFRPGRIRSAERARPNMC